MIASRRSSLLNHSPASSRPEQRSPLWVASGLRGAAHRAWLYGKYTSWSGGRNHAISDEAARSMQRIQRTLDREKGRGPLRKRPYSVCRISVQHMIDEVGIGHVVEGGTVHQRRVVLANFQVRLCAIDRGFLIAVQVCAIGDE